MRIDPGEPAPHPVVLPVVDDVQKRRGRDRERDRRAGVLERRRDVLAQESTAPAGGRRRPHVLQERARLAHDQRRDVAVPRRQAPARVGPALPPDRRRLVGRQRIDREEPRRMPGQPVHGDHPDPAVDAVQAPGRFPLDQVGAQPADLVERAFVKEHVEAVGPVRGRVQRQPREPGFDLRLRRRVQPRFDQDAGNRIDVVAQGVASQQHRFEQRRAAPHERVEDDVAGIRQPGDEEPRQLRLEAGAVGNLVQGMRRALLRRPELVREDRNAAACLDVRPPAVTTPPFELVRERVGRPALPAAERQPVLHLRLPARSRQPKRSRSRHFRSRARRTGVRLAG